MISDCVGPFRLCACSQVLRQTGWQSTAMSRGASHGPQHRYLLWTETRTGLGRSVTYTIPVLRQKVPSSVLPVRWFCLLVLCEVQPDTLIRTWVKTQWREVWSRGGTAMHRPARVTPSGSSGETRWDTPRPRGVGRFGTDMWQAACDETVQYEPLYEASQRLLNWSDEFNVIRIPCGRLIIQYLIQQTARSVINNHLSLLHVSTCTRSSSGSYIQRLTATGNSVNCVVKYNIAN
jgi:hypothetical protein